jgi:3-oxoacyl-[acyl-carrier protein] reductase
MRLPDRVAIVTGGAKGIGRHYVHALAAEGAKVVIADIDGPAADAAAADIGGAGGHALARTDVADETSVSAMVEQTLASFGRIDILVNNAAIFAAVPATRGTHDRITVDEWDRLYSVNVRGVWLCCRAVVPHMRVQGYGKIINISSGTAWKGSGEMVHYASSKAAVAGMTRALARELGASAHICVNAIAPGNTESDTWAELTTDEEKRRVLGQRIFQRAEQPEDLVGTLLFLASSDSDFMTGQTLHVDGGSVLT